MALFRRNAEQAGEHPSPNALADGQADVQRAREDLERRLHGDHAVALRAVADDALLTQALTDAIAQGMPPIDFGLTFKHARPQAVIDAIAEWNESTSGGPCWFCGSPQRRPDGDGFTTSRGHVACGHCANWLREHDASYYAMRVFNAVAGLTGIPVWGEYPIVSFAGEQSPVYVGTPWGWLIEDRHEYIVQAIESGLPRGKFAATPGAIDQAGLPGLPAPDHAPSDDMWRAHAPKRKTAFASPESAQRQRAMHDDFEAESTRRRKRHEAARAAHLRQLAQEDERRNAG